GEQAVEEWESRRGGTLDSYRQVSQRYAIPVVEVLLNVYHTMGLPRAQDALRLIEHARWRSLIEHYGEELLTTPPDFPEDLKRRETELIQELRAYKMPAVE